MSEKDEVSLKELMLANFKATKAEFKAGNEVLNITLENVNNKLEKVITHQKETNGRINKLEADTKILNIIKKKPLISLSIFFASIYAVILIKDHHVFIEIIKFLKLIS